MGAGSVLVGNTFCIGWALGQHMDRHVGQLLLLKCPNGTVMLVKCPLSVSSGASREGPGGVPGGSRGRVPGGSWGVGNSAGGSKTGVESRQRA